MFLNRSVQYLFLKMKQNLQLFKIFEHLADKCEVGTILDSGTNKWVWGVEMKLAVRLKAKKAMMDAVN